MKTNWQIIKFINVLLFTVLLVFSFLFFQANQYWISFFSLGLIVISLRLNDIKTFAINSNGITAKFNNIQTEMAKVIKSPESTEKKLKESQNLIDQVFRLGYKAGGGKPFNDISNVKIFRDKNGKITNYQYDEN